VNAILALGLFAAVVASFASAVEVVGGAAVLACAVAWVADRGALKRVLSAGLVLGAVFAAAAAAAAVAWSSGLERGLLIGATVLLRIIVLAVAAAVVSRSVDAEGILRATSRFGMERLGLSLGLALNSLPHLVTTATTVWTAHRVRFDGGRFGLGRLPALAEVLLAHTGRVAEQAAAAAALRGHTTLGRAQVAVASQAPTVVVTGPPGCGKTPLVEKVVDCLAGAGQPAAGFVQPAIISGGEKTGFEVRNVATGESAELARKVTQGEGRHGTAYRFRDEGFALAGRALDGAAPGVVLVIDELGPVELRGGGHWPAVERALKTDGLAGVIVVVRRTLVPTLVEALDAVDVIVVDLEGEADDPVAVVIGALHGGDASRSFQ
jgi:nucleoside-triphosphatase